MMQSSIKHVPKRYNWIVGIDEAGRGPLAGPLSVGIVLIHKNKIDHVAKHLVHVRDSKKLSPSKREDIIQQARALEISGHLFARTVLTDAYTIDNNGLSDAIRQSIQEGIAELVEFVGINPKTVFVQLDGSLKAPHYYRQQTTVGGDGKIFAIALASIYAKTARDNIMEQYDIRYPQYNFYSHKGYGTAEHIKHIKKYGLCPIHRRSFLKKYVESV